MESFNIILNRKKAYYGDTKACTEFAAEEYATQSKIEELSRFLKLIEGQSYYEAIDTTERRIAELKAMIAPIKNNFK